MFENICFYVFFTIVYVLTNVAIFVRGLSYVQLSGYTIISPFKQMLILLKERWLLFFLYFVLIICLNLLEVYNVLFLIILIIFIGLQIVYTCLKEKTKIVITKRLIRISLVSIILLIINYLFCVFLISKILLAYLFIFQPFVTLFLIFLALCILVPVEQSIKNYFINLAKAKLLQNKKLIKIGITGSFGKTSVKEILTSILKKQYVVLSTPESFNTPMGVSKTINEYLQNSHEIFVCEMGAKKKGEIKELCEISGVDWGIVTSVGRQHTNSFGGIKNIYETKKELPDFLFKKSCVFNLMNRYTAQMYDEFVGDKIGVFVVRIHDKKLQRVFIKRRDVQAVKVVRQKSCVLFEYRHDNGYYAKSVICSENGSRFDIFKSNKFLFSAETKLMGMHNIINILLAIAMADRLAIKLNNLKRGIKDLAFVKARLEKFVTKNGAIVINNGYNSNIDSAKSSMEVLSLINKNRKFIITPGIIETEDDFSYNRQFGKLISKYCTDIIIVKEKNKSAIIAGLDEMCFDLNRVYFAKAFNDVRVIIDNADSDTVFLIENDLPDNFK